MFPAFSVGGILLIGQARPFIQPNAGFVKQLHRWQGKLKGRTDVAWITLWQMNSSTLKSPFLSGNSFFQALSARFELLIYWRVQSNNITDVFQEPEFQQFALVVCKKHYQALNKEIWKSSNLLFLLPRPAFIPFFFHLVEGLCTS